MSHQNVSLLSELFFLFGLENSNDRNYLAITSLPGECRVKWKMAEEYNIYDLAADKWKSEDEQLMQGKQAVIVCWFLCASWKISVFLPILFGLSIEINLMTRESNWLKYNLHSKTSFPLDTNVNRRNHYYLFW